MFYFPMVALSRNIGTSIEKPLPLYLFKEYRNATHDQAEKDGYYGCVGQPFSITSTNLTMAPLIITLQ
jgi:hypothetical protein